MLLWVFSLGSYLQIQIRHRIEQVLDLTQDEEGEEVPEDAIAEKASADVILADKSIDETLQEIDAELAAEKAADVASQ